MSNHGKESVMEKVMAGIVSFNPDMKRLEENIKAIEKQVHQIILVDNGSKEQELLFQTIKQKFPNVLLLQNKENLGIAKALNQLLEECHKNNGRWLLTLDQDSVAPDNLMAVYSKYTDMEDVAMICPRIVDRNSNMTVEHGDDKEKEYVFVDRCITSASLMDVEKAMETGSFDESMFIDYVDFEYCIRVRKNGYRILKANGAELLHELGNTVTKSLPGKKIQVLNHSPFRKYYYVRNIIYTYRKHRDVLPGTYCVKPIAGIVIKTILFEKEKGKKLKQMWKGYKDGKKAIISGRL